MKSIAVFIVSLFFFKKILGQIRRVESLEGDDVILKCPRDSLSDIISNNSVAWMTTLTLSRRIRHDSQFTVMAVYDVIQNIKYLWNRTEPMMRSVTWTINYSYTTGLQITMKKATASDTGIYMCQGSFFGGNEIKNVNITQEVVIKAKPPPVAAKADPGNNTLTPAAIAGIVISLVCVVVFNNWGYLVPA